MIQLTLLDGKKASIVNQATFFLQVELYPIMETNHISFVSCLTDKNMLKG